ncbi:hypothetical protein B9Z19DRAFT_1128344 [Tuber borchii]|uniref:Uncharacterized protein n=1 Tax=Tuber borchii TaxID=42251 RepID=A0A2T6ZPT9_TUBBO|nr:hypothetical protein B9Z19DRAFT_1128344 [Tuber borchii]
MKGNFTNLYVKNSDPEDLDKGILKLNPGPMIAAGSMIITSSPWGRTIAEMNERYNVRKGDAVREEMCILRQAPDEDLRRQKETLEARILQKKLDKMEEAEKAAAGSSPAGKSSGN